MNSVHNFLFYPRLALTNMKKNASIYRPYLLAGGLLAGHTDLQDSHQKHIQHNVHKAAGDQKIQRALGVSHRPEDTCSHIVDQVGDGAYEIDPEIDHGRLHNILRGG